jgi:hypothetical protein
MRILGGRRWVTGDECCNAAQPGKYSTIDSEARLTFAMLLASELSILFASFILGYGVRAGISHLRRAEARRLYETRGHSRPRPRPPELNEMRAVARSASLAARDVNQRSDLTQ